MIVCAVTKSFVVSKKYNNDEVLPFLLFLEILLTTSSLESNIPTFYGLGAGAATDPVFFITTPVSDTSGILP